MMYEDDHDNLIMWRLSGAYGTLLCRGVAMQVREAWFKQKAEYTIILKHYELLFDTDKIIQESAFWCIFYIKTHTDILLFFSQSASLRVIYTTHYSNDFSGDITMDSILLSMTIWHRTWLKRASRGPRGSIGAMCAVGRTGLPEHMLNEDLISFTFTFMTSASHVWTLTRLPASPEVLFLILLGLLTDTSQSYKYLAKYDLVIDQYQLVLTSW